ncbi:MAG TPA: GNAT family N-acetyltransferase [Cytophagaceae bacterium]
MKLTIKNDTKTQKFFIDIFGKECALKYEKTAGDTILDLKMMFVPKNLRGQGVASKLVEYAIQYAKKNNLKVRASGCDYIQEYLDTHKEHQEMIAQPVI